MKKKIPIENIYYLLMYSWGALPSKGQVDLAGLENEDFKDCLIDIFITELTRLTRKGLHRDYIENDELLSVLKGKVNWASSIVPIKLKGKVDCTIDDYSENIQLNKIIKSICLSLLRTSDTSDEQKKTIKAKLISFKNVESIILDKNEFASCQFSHLTKKDYYFMIKLCEMIHNNLMPTDGNGNGEFSFVDFERNEEKMRKMFESFVRGFFKRQLKGEAKVKAEKIKWDLNGESQDLSVLPNMDTDTSIIYEDKKIIIETKFTPTIFKKRFEDSREKLRSEHLYQLSSYLKNHEKMDDLTGILLYPSTGKKLRLEYSHSDYRLFICTIDLSQPWEELRDELLSLQELAA